MEAGRTSGEAHAPPPVAAPLASVGEAGPSDLGRVAALGGNENVKHLMNFIAQTTSQVALTTGNQLLAKFREEISSQVPISQSIIPSGTTVGGSRAGMPISGRSAPETTTPAPPMRRIRFDWDLDLLSLPQEQNNDVNAKVRLVAARHFKIWDQWKEQPTEKKQECINELRAFYKGIDAIPDSFFRDKKKAKTGNNGGARKKPTAKTRASRRR
ncbi:hypothetical protein R1sor_007324 [Riccia sorocarpa]|uniref:Uncharacterized protein n=1 Tax=Riccia sorocarpa TaxID=122646 RepID=A0ABD3HQJ7_9MARC